MMKKYTLLIFLFCFTFFGLQAQDVKTLCGENVDYSHIIKDLNIALEDVDSCVMLDLSMQTPKMTVVPVDITKLVNLTYLNLSFNRISLLPSVLADLENLSCLDLSGNHYLRFLPLFLNDMPNLKIVKLQDLSWSAAQQEQVRKQFPNILFIF